MRERERLRHNRGFCTVQPLQTAPIESGRRSDAKVLSPRPRLLTGRDGNQHRIPRRVGRGRRQGALEPF